jgi:hypothetical protein
LTTRPSMSWFQQRVGREVANVEHRPQRSNSDSGRTACAFATTSAADCYLMGVSFLPLLLRV